MPNGLTIDLASGIISGTPVGAGVFSFTIQVTDSALPQGVVSKAFTLTINNALLLTITTNPSLPDGVVGSPYSLTFSLANGTAPYIRSIASGSFPLG